MCVCVYSSKLKSSLPRGRSRLVNNNGLTQKKGRTPPFLKNKINNRFDAVGPICGVYTQI
jgi:hypothetical protein